MTLTVSQAPWDGADGERLRAAMTAELAARYEIPDQETDSPTAEDIDVFLIARDGDGEAIGCGALRRLDDGTIEVKRMYVAPAVRGSGVATAILRELEEHACAAGVDTVQLSTGTKQPDAVRFYEREGYGPLAGHPMGVFFIRRVA